MSKQSIQDIQRVLTNMALSKDSLSTRSSALTGRDFLSSTTTVSRQSQRPMTAAYMRAPTARSSRTLPAIQKQSKSVCAELYCGPCSRDGMYREAAGFCIECSEYFCDNCIKHHKNLKITKSHEVRDRKKMPKVKHAIDHEESVETCGLHPGELVRYHCPDHDESCCGICATLDHRQCIDLAYIPAMKAKKTNKSCAKMVRHINTMVSQFERARQDTARNIKKLDLQQEDFQQAVARFHQEVKDALQALEKSTLRDMNFLQSDEQGFLASRLEMCDETIKTLRQASGTLEITLKNGIESKTFLQLKKASKQVSMYESLLEDIRVKNLQPLTFKFTPSEYVKNFAHKADTLGLVDIRQRTKKSAVFLTQLTAKSRSDTYETCDITGSSVLPDGRIVLADMTNETIKLTDLSYRQATQTKLSSEPWDVCAISNDQIVVSLPREKRLQLLNIRVTIRPLRKIGNAGSVNPSQFYGVAYFQEKLFVTCPKDEIPNVKILDMQGRILQQFNSDAQGENLFSDPLYIAASFNGRSIYISDSGKNAVVYLEPSVKNKIEIFETPEQSLPGGITVQPEGHVYLCSFTANCVQHMSVDGQFLQDVIGKDGDLSSPQTLSYCAKERRLIVTMQKSDTVKVFQLC